MFLSIAVLQFIDHFV